MSGARIEDFINERVRLITLGETLAGEELIHVYLPTFTKAHHMGITLTHEGLHLELIRNSELGWFEAAFGKLYQRVVVAPDPDAEVEKAYNILRHIAENSWMTHESYAEYGSVMQAFGDSPAQFSAYINDNLLPSDYRTALLTYCNVIGAPTKGMERTRISVLCHLAACVSEAALNIPILTRFKSYAEVSEQSVADFLRQHNPDNRQKEILNRLRDQALLNNLLEKAESFVKEKIAKHSQDAVQGQKGALDSLKDAVAIGWHTKEFIAKELKTLIPQVVSWVPVDQRLKQAQAILESWRSEWISCGYENATLLRFESYIGSDDALMKSVDSFLRTAKTEISPISKGQKSLFYKRGFWILPLHKVKQHIEAVKAIHADLLVCVEWNAGKTPIRVFPSVMLEAQSAGFYILPWQWNGDDKLESIYAATRANPLVGPCFFSCPITLAQKSIDAFGALNTVWVRWLELDESLTNSGKKLPNFRGLSFICAAGSTIEQIIQKCEQFAEEGNLNIFFASASSGTMELEAEAVFVVAVLPNKTTFHIFPNTFVGATLIKEALRNIDTVAFLKEPDKIRTIGNIDVLSNIMHFFYNIESTAVLYI